MDGCLIVSFSVCHWFAQESLPFLKHIKLRQLHFLNRDKSRKVSLRLGGSVLQKCRNWLAPPPDIPCAKNATFYSHSHSSFWFFNFRWVEEIPQSRNQVTLVVWELFAVHPCQKSWNVQSKEVQMPQFEEVTQLWPGQTSCQYHQTKYDYPIFF